MKHRSTFSRGLDLDARACALSELLERLQAVWQGAIHCRSLDDYNDLRDALRYTMGYVHACDQDDALLIGGYIETAYDKRLTASDIATEIEAAMDKCNENLDWIYERRDEEERAA